MTIMTTKVLQDNFATVAEVYYKGKRVTGSAKRAKGDRSNPDVGRDLATARALAKLAQHLENKAWKQINRADKEAEAKARARLACGFGAEATTKDRVYGWCKTHSAPVLMDWADSNCAVTDKRYTSYSDALDHRGK